ncbi:JM160 [macacine gammaherpesvirus 11]|uniref:JM160 n=2 Tax=macacine gammaherpesvirus 11 TaxID=2560570 RepID=G9JMY7_9GAMA|nr:JM160 [Macaca fuscata rhadinovirus]AAT00137.1 JM160 [Macaca fuscata rhadinovirus]AEW87684.1 JM160 [Macaca fuscata rhadinovirus]AEW87854.1 JM160 [Macaca fuscata rhadinovirus]
MDALNNNLNLLMDFLSNYSNSYSSYDDNISYTLDTESTLCRLTIIFPPTIYAIICFFIFCITLLGNALVLYIFFKFKALANSVDVLMAGLCCNSLFLCASFLFSWLLYVAPQILTPATCKVEIFFFYLYTYFGVYIVVCISLIRCLLVVFSRRPWVKHWASGFLCVCVSLIVALALSANASLYRTALRHPETSEWICYEDAGEDTVNWKLRIRTISAICGFLVPFGLLVLFYGLTWCIVKSTKLARKGAVRGVIVTVVVLFLIFCLPYHLCNFFDTLLRTGFVTETCYIRDVISVAMHICSLLQSMYSAFVPVVYSGLGSLFRRRVRDTWSMFRCFSTSGSL